MLWIMALADILSYFSLKPSTVVRAYNSCFSGGRDQEDHGSRLAWQMLVRPISANKEGMMVSICDPRC
jgi:hypothetical protein